MTDMLRKQKPITITKPKYKPKPEHHRQQLQPPPTSLSKPNRGPTMVVCGRRSSIKAISKNAYGKNEIERIEKLKRNRR